MNSSVSKCCISVIVGDLCIMYCDNPRVDLNPH
jgi:hypothetical protein